MYFSRWHIDDQFRHAKDRNIPVQLEIGSYNVHQRSFSIFDKIDGPDEIHDTFLCSNGEDLVFVEMGQDPVVDFPDNVEELSPQLLWQIHDKGLVHSQVIVYNLKTQKYYAQVYPNAPGHIEPGLQENIYYISQ